MNRMCIVSVLIGIVIGLALANDLTEEERQISTKTPDELWESYKTLYNKEYASADEEAYRKGIVLEKYRKLQEQLELRNKSMIIHTINISKYSDLNHKEFMEKMFGPESNQQSKYLPLSELIPRSTSPSISFNGFLFAVFALFSSL